MFKRVDANIDLPVVESEISAYWDKINAFETSVENRKNDKTFRFYDGPPFPTGSPHYGNLLAGVIKDIVPRYWTMRGYYVERRFGWDVHGLPIEMEVQKKLNLVPPANRSTKRGTDTAQDRTWGCGRNIGPQFGIRSNCGPK